MTIHLDTPSDITVRSLVNGQAIIRNREGMSGVKDLFVVVERDGTNGKFVRAHSDTRIQSPDDAVLHLPLNEMVTPVDIVRMSVRLR